jgi:hypothetical protein
VDGWRPSRASPGCEGGGRDFPIIEVRFLGTDDLVALVPLAGK